VAVTLKVWLTPAVRVVLAGVLVNWTMPGGGDCAHTENGRKESKAAMENRRVVEVIGGSRSGSEGEFLIPRILS
jgi:hypothetical protein